MSSNPSPSRNPRWEAVATTASATILTSVSGRASKVHTATPGGGWSTQGYDRLHTFAATPFEAQDLRSFMATLVEWSQHPRALLVAEVPHPASNWKRLPRRIHGSDPGIVRSLVGTSWVCWEVDNVAQVPEDVDPRLHADRDADFVRWWMAAHLPAEFAASSAVLQWSASAFVGGRLCMHIWQWLDRPVSRESIHAYMEDHKRDDPPHWRRYIDTTIWDGARVHYISDPVFMAEDGKTGLPDLLSGRRWQWVHGEAGDAACALPEWEDEAAWLERLGREAAAMEATKLQAAEERAKRSSAEAGRRARGERPQEAAGDETGALLEVSCLGCRLEDLDPKRVLAWAAKAVASGARKIHGAVAGDVVEGRHPAIREAGFIAGNILAGLAELEAALSAEVQARVGWHSGVTAVERGVDELEAAAVAVGGVDRARVLRWAVMIGRSTPVVPDYRTPEQYRQGGGKVVSMKTKKVLPTYEGQPSVEVEVEVDGETGEVVENSWRLDLRLNKAGNPKGTLSNLELVALNDPDFGEVRWNDLAAMLEVWGSPAWAPRLPDGSQLKDHHVDEMRLWLERSYEMSVTADSAWSIARVIGHRKAYDSLRDYLRGLKWDGVPRIFDFSTKYLNAEDTEAARLAGGWWLMAAAHRALEPGCQSDYVLTLEGEQGVSKSQLLMRLVPDRKHTMVFQGDPASPKSIESIRGKWLIELAELSVLGKGRDMRIVKGFVTCMADDYRAPWARAPEQYLRRCAFLATVNPEGEGGYLADSTGNRRWWPVKILKPVDLDAVERDRDQLWAEAVELLGADLKGKHWPTPEETDRLFRPEQKKREDEHAWTDKVFAWASERGAVTLGGVLDGALNIPAERWSKRDQMDVAAILQKLGWSSVKGVRVGQLVDGSPVMKGEGRLDNKRWWSPPAESTQPAEVGGGGAVGVKSGVGGVGGCPF